MYCTVLYSTVLYCTVHLLLSWWSGGHEITNEQTQAASLLDVVVTYLKIRSLIIRLQV